MIGKTQSPPVALVHGFATSSARTWGDNGWLDLLADAGRETVPIDVLGHGTADKPHDPAAYTDLEGYVAERLPDEPSTPSGGASPTSRPGPPCSGSGSPP